MSGDEPRGAPSLARALGRLALNSLRREPPCRPPRRLERGGIRVHRAALRRYLAATAGDGVHRFAGDDAVLPPVYPALWELPLALELLAAAGQGLPRGVVHLSSERLFVRAACPRDVLRCEVSLETETHDAGGVRRVIVCRTTTPAGGLCGETRLALLFDPRRTAPQGAAVPSAPEADHGAEGFAEIERWRLRAGHGRRYARASGDYNPIHLFAWTARPFGYRRPVLHGLCLEAIVAHALIARRLGGEPAALRRLRIAFPRPALLPAELRLLVAPHDRGGAFRVVRVTDARAVAEGEWGGG